MSNNDTTEIDRNSISRPSRLRFSVYLTSKFFSLVASIVIQLVLVKFLSTQEYVSFIVLSSTVIFGTNLLNLGINRAVYKFIPIYLGHRALLRSFVLHIFLLRLSSFAAFGLLFYAGMTRLESWVGLPLSDGTLAAFVIWFVLSLWSIDLDALAQANMLHHQLTILAIADAILRFAGVIIVVGWGDGGSAQSIVMVFTITTSISFTALVALVALAWRRTAAHERAPTTPATTEGWTSVRFAAAVHAATLGWVVSSPAAVRLAAASGLSVVALAGFSFGQGLFTSLQRLLPGQMVLPSLEPLILADMSSQNSIDRSYASMSLLFKVELVSLLTVGVFTAVSGDVVLSLLSRPVFAPYSFILPVLSVLLIFNIAHRIFEIIATMSFRQNVFFAILPLSLASLTTIYATVGSMGLLAVLGIPMIEGVIRVAILSFWLRHQHPANAFDPQKSGVLIALAATVAAVGWLTRRALNVSSGTEVLALAAAVGIAWLGLVLLTRPLRIKEREIVSRYLPARLPGAPRVLDLLTVAKHD